jgi:hypothetical protein
MMKPLPAKTRITCERGHHICKTASDLIAGNSFILEDFTAWQQSVPEVGGKPACEKCGGEFWREGNYFHTDKGWWPGPEFEGVETSSNDDLEEIVDTILGIISICATDKIEIDVKGFRKKKVQIVDWLKLKLVMRKFLQGGDLKLEDFQETIKQTKIKKPQIILPE